MSRPFLRFISDIETRLVRPDLPERVTSPIYITGLARSGTTILLEMLSHHPDLASHKYRDFPFLYIPIIWNWFYDRSGKKDIDAVERAHKDRIMVTPQSPEALEEMIWMDFFADCHDIKHNNILSVINENPKFERFYYDHILKIINLRGGKRYLSKGNYNISRLEYIYKLFPDAKFILPVRSPKGHIASLMKQHKLFCEEESRDKRILNHMNRMGHFEFGLNRRPINFNNDKEALEIDKMWAEGDEIRGWARYWAAVYGNVIQSLKNNPNLRKSSLIVIYEELCTSPLDKLKLVYDHCKLGIDNKQLSEHAGKITYPDYYSVSFNKHECEVIQDETEAVEESLKDLCKNSTG
jgi:hypothetical protein